MHTIVVDADGRGQVSTGTIAVLAGASNAELKPVRVADGTQAFMFESHFMLTVTPWAAETCGKVQPDYYKVWQDLKSNFTGPASGSA